MDIVTASIYRFEVFKFTKDGDLEKIHEEITGVKYGTNFDSVVNAIRDYYEGDVINSEKIYNRVDIL